VARSIAAALDNPASDQHRLVKRGSSLLSFLSRHVRALGLDRPPAAAAAAGADPLLEESDEALRRELRMLAWVPVWQQPPRQGLPWPAAGRRMPLAPPSTVRLARDAMLASHAMSLCSGAELSESRYATSRECLLTFTQLHGGVTEDVTSEALCEFLGWNDAVPPAVLALQLIELAALHGRELAVNPLEQPMSEAALPPEVRETVGAIYGMLCEKMDTEEFQVVRAQLQARPWVLIGDAFVSRLCVSVCGRAFVRVRVCVCACVRVRVCVCVRARLWATPW
jgi:hypothetical protein